MVLQASDSLPPLTQRLFLPLLLLLLPTLVGSSCITTRSTQQARVNFNSKTTEHGKCIIQYIFVDIAVFGVCIIYRLPPRKYIQDVSRL